MNADVVIAPVEELARHFVADLLREIRAAPANTRFTLAVPGGSVAEAFLPGLIAAAVDWNQVDVFWADERAVPPWSPESNYALADRLWLVPARVPYTRIHRMPAEEPALAQAAEKYAFELCAAAGSPPRLDYVLLGAGADGHVASIFPHDLPALERSNQVVSWTDRAPKLPHRRMTLTLSSLAAARRAVVAAFGTAKAEAIAAALHEPDDRSPLGVLLRTAARPLVLLDPGAAALLGSDGASGVAPRASSPRHRPPND